MSDLKADAAKISPEAVKLVAEKAPWEEPLKVGSVEALSCLTAKYANKFGIPAEAKEEVGFLALAAGWLASRSMLKSELAAMAATKAKEPKP